MIRFRCPSCQQLCSAGESATGKRRSCPGCGQVIEVPVPVAVPEEDPWQALAQPEADVAEVDRDEAPAAPAKVPPESTAGRTCAILSVVCSLLAAILCPPFFGLAGLILGVVGIALCREKFLAVAGVVLSIVATAVGMFLWFAVWVSLASR